MRRPIGRRQQQRAQRVVLALALEGAAERQRARERDRNPQDAGRHIVQRRGLPRPAPNENTSTTVTAKNSVVDSDLEAAHLDREVLAHDEPRDAEEAAHDVRHRLPVALAQAARCRCRCRPCRPSLQEQIARVSRPSATSRSCVASTIRQPARCRSRSRADQRRGRRLIETGERLVEQQQPRLVQQRALERHALAHAAREARHRDRRRARRGRRARAPASTTRGDVGEAVRAARRTSGSRARSARDRETDRGRACRCARGAPAPPCVGGAVAVCRRVPRRRRQQRGENGEERGLAGAVRPEQADDLAGRRT